MNVDVTRLVWAKTDAGRAEISGRTIIKNRAQRNLLLIIDGKTTADKLLAGLAGITVEDFASLESLGLIATVRASAPAAAVKAPDASGDAIDIDVSGFDYAVLRSSIGRLISKELGMRGLTLSMILEESLTVEDLKGVAQRLLKQIAERKGEQAAAEARKVLFGR
ncbi:MAG TPA: hypothetical protein VHM00_15075 [Caldimonas sp.]|nr:hypothetical protein [Caldimonas sp.]HEX2542391.1 hypothetical protein [Caldimonas sp.]